METGSRVRERRIPGQRRLVQRQRWRRRDYACKKYSTVFGGGGRGQRGKKMR